MNRNYEKVSEGRREVSHDSKQGGKVWPLLFRALMVFFMLLIIVAAFNYGTIIKIYRGITLFTPTKLEKNFRSLDQWFEARLVAPGEDIFEFKYDLHDLPSHYEYAGETRSVAQFIDDTKTTGLVITSGDVIFYEKYFGESSEATRWILWSVSKSVVSALVGIAIDEGYIKDIDDPVTDYVPSLIASGYNGVSIQNALQMSSGIGFVEDYGDPNSDVNRMGALATGFGKSSLEDFLLGLENEREPGTYNKYASSDAQVLGMVVREATGMDLATYMQEKLWKPTGMEADAFWLIDNTGVEAAFGGLNMTLRDMTRFGNLYLHEGFWNGQQIIPREWVRASHSADAPHLVPRNNRLGYGYQWWVPSGEYDDYLAMGIYGQAIYINPTYNVVIAKTSAYQEYVNDGNIMELESVAFFRAIAKSLGTGDRH